MPTNAKIATFATGATLLAAAAMAVIPADQGVSTTVKDSADCSRQTWPYIDARCAPASQKEMKRIRVISTDRNAPDTVAFVPRTRPVRSRATAEKTAVQETKTKAKEAKNADTATADKQASGNANVRAAFAAFISLEINEAATFTYAASRTPQVRVHKTRKANAAVVGIHRNGRTTAYVVPRAGG